jgi:prenyltransferase beta subunit
LKRNKTLLEISFGAITKGLFFFVSILLAVCISSVVNAQTPAVANGLNYLTSTQNPDGSWGSDLTDTELLPSTVTVIETLQILDQTSLPNYSNAISWLQSQGLETTDYLSERIYALSVLGTDGDLLLSYIDELEYVWGVYNDFGVNNLDTALALSALKKINYSDQNTIDYALNYLLSTQNSDGGWGLQQGRESSVYYTALISSVLQQFSRTTSIATAINKATAYLIAHQNVDGGFGEGGGTPPLQSTVYATAYAYLALVNETTDSTVLGNAINYLTSTQLPNGSWEDDPYSTALALRALANVKPNLSISSTDITFSNPTPTVGETITITANVKNSGIAQADGVLVQFYDGDPSAGGVLIGETTISSIPSFGSSQASIQWTIPDASAHIIFVKIDPLNVIDELDETDNIASKNLTSATLPDLSITSGDIEIFPPVPDPYIMVGIFYKVRNHGETDATDVLVEVYDGDPSKGNTF